MKSWFGKSWFARRILVFVVVACYTVLDRGVLVGAEDRGWVTFQYQEIHRAHRLSDSAQVNGQSRVQILLELRKRKIAALESLAEQCPRTMWPMLADADVVALGNVLLESGRYEAVLQLTESPAFRPGIAVEMYRAKVRAFMYLKRFPDAWRTLEESGEGHGGGRLGELHLPFLLLTSGTGEWSRAIKHGREAMLHLQWQVERDPKQVVACGLFIRAYARALRERGPGQLRDAMRGVVRGAENACQQADFCRSDGRVRMALHREMAFWACREGLLEGADEQLTEWIELLCADRIWKPTDRLNATNRLVSILEDEAGSLTRDNVRLQSQLNRLASFLANADVFDSNEERDQRVLCQRCRNLLNRTRVSVLKPSIE